jgi:hypothetical protein
VAAELLGHAVRRDRLARDHAREEPSRPWPTLGELGRGWGCSARCRRRSVPSSFAQSQGGAADRVSCRDFRRVCGLARGCRIDLTYVQFRRCDRTRSRG